MTHDYHPFKKLGANYYDDPWKELAYRVLERTIRDAKGIDMAIHSSKKGERQSVIMEARAFMKSEVFELLCDGLEIDHDLIRKKARV